MTNFSLEIEQNDEEHNGSPNLLTIIEVKDMSFNSNNRILPLNNIDRIEKKAFLSEGKSIRWFIYLARKKHLKLVLEEDGKNR